MNGFKNALVYVENKGIIKTSCSYSNGIICSLEKDQTVTNTFKLPDSAVILPGFIDQHIHGAGGCDVMDATEESFKRISTSIASEGVTSYLATTMTQSKENISKVMKCVNRYIKSKVTVGAEMIGVHLEGPYINPQKAGAQPLNYVVAPNYSEFKQYNELSGNNVKIVTLAPEIENAGKFVRQLINDEVIVSVGHSNATFNQFQTAVSNGITQITHTFNAQSPFTHREIGIAGGAMLLNEVACEVICDLVHVNKDALRLLFKNKPKDKIIFISDSMRAKNLGDVESELGGQKVYVKNGEARLANGTLAGSVLRLNDAIKNAVNVCKMPFIQAIDCVSANPAKNLRLFNEIGGIKVGKKANFAVMDRNSYDILLTVRNGKIIYKNANLI